MSVLIYRTFVLGKEVPGKQKSQEIKDDFRFQKENKFSMIAHGTCKV